jgi:hypothetical protein
VVGKKAAMPPLNGEATGPKKEEKKDDEKKSAN